jgi:hypothetical protein
MTSTNNPLFPNLNCIYRTLSFVSATGRASKIAPAWFRGDSKLPRHAFLAVVCSSWREVVTEYSAAVRPIRQLVNSEVETASELFSKWFEIASRNNFDWILETLLRSEVPIDINNVADITNVQKALTRLRQTSTDLLLNLTSAKLKPNVYTTVAFQLVKTFPHITSLSISSLNSKITQNEDNYQMLFKQLKSLHSFDAKAIPQLEDSHLELLFSSSSQNLLRKVRIRSCPKISDQALLHLSKLQFLQSLCINDTRTITDAGVEHLRELKHLTNLDLAQCRAITEIALERGVSKMVSLTRLSLSSCASISEEGLKFLSSLKLLRVLDLGICSHISDNGMKYLADVPSLEKIDVFFCDKLSPVCLAFLSPALTSLRYIGLDCVPLITDDGLLELSKFSQLSTIKLSHDARITDEGLKNLSILTKLETLDLNSCTAITSEGLSHLSKVKTLQSLEIPRCAGVRDDGLRFLRNCPNLEVLNVRECSWFSDSSLEILVQFPRLLNLNITGCYKVTDAGFKLHLSNLKTLRILAFPYCSQVTSRVLEHLLKLPVLDPMKMTCDLPPENISKFKEAMLGLQILKAVTTNEREVKPRELLLD